jgi:RNA polymerase sigma-70 factor (ECF subfamily)
MSTATSLLCRHELALHCCSICQPTTPDTNDTLNAKLDEILATAHPRLLRLARLNGVAADEAEDVVQETYIEAWKHLENLREPERFASWLDGICRNICKRHKHTLATHLHTNALPVYEDESDAINLDVFDAQGIDPIEELERQDMHILLDRALGYLSAGTRELIELCYLAELPQREVAQRLDMSLGALELKLHRARRQLRQVLNGELRADAAAFGLLLKEDEAMAWQETRQWCWLCGKKRMRGMFERWPSGLMGLRLRCPDCSLQYDMDMTNTAGIVSLEGLRSFRPAMKRALQGAAAYYSIVLNEHRCGICQARVQLRLVDRTTPSEPPKPYDQLPQGTYLRIDCPNCGPCLCELVSIQLLNPSILSFIQNRSRVISEPNITATYAGQDAIRSRLIDLSTSEQITVMTHPETLQVMAAIQG